MDWIETVLISAAVSLGVAVFTLRYIREKVLDQFDDIDWEP
jgi:uncharacterized protein YkuJ